MAHSHQVAQASLHSHRVPLSPSAHLQAGPVKTCLLGRSRVFVGFLWLQVCQAFPATMLPADTCLCWWPCAGGARSLAPATAELSPVCQHTQTRFQTMLLWRPFVHQPRTGVRSCACGAFPRRLHHSACFRAGLAPRRCSQRMARARWLWELSFMQAWGMWNHVAGMVVVSADGGTSCTQAPQKVLQSHLCDQGAGHRSPGTISQGALQLHSIGPLVPWAATPPSQACVQRGASAWLTTAVL